MKSTSADFTSFRKLRLKLGAKDSNCTSIYILRVPCRKRGHESIFPTRNHISKYKGLTESIQYALIKKAWFCRSKVTEPPPHTLSLPGKTSYAAYLARRPLLGTEPEEPQTVLRRTWHSMLLSRGPDPRRVRAPKRHTSGTGKENETYLCRGRWETQVFIIISSSNIKNNINVPISNAIIQTSGKYLQKSAISRK